MSAAFEVVRQNWYRFPHSGPAAGWRRIQGEAVLASFPTRAAAEADATKRERAARAAVNPFRCGVVWTDRTEMPEPVFADWVADHDLPEPPRADGRRDWAAWWERLRAEFSPAHREMVWGVLTNLRFHSVREREREPGPRLFVLYRVASEQVTDQIDRPGGGWTYQWDGRVRLRPEGGDDLEVSLDRARLERRALELFEQDREYFHDDERCDVRLRDGDPFTDDGEPAYEPVAPHHRYRGAEIPLDEEPASGRPVYVASRAAHFLADDGRWVLDETDASCAVVPVRAFRKQADGRACCEELNRQTHAVMDPTLWAPGWSTGACDCEPLVKLGAAWGLPPVPTRESAEDPGKRVGVLSDLADWWEANGHDLTPARRAEWWANLGEYAYFSLLTRYTPDQPGGEAV